MQIDVRLEDGGPFARAALLVTLTDGSAQRRVMEERATLNSVLETEVAAGTERVRGLDDELATHVRGLTHDLQAPLRRVSGRAGRLFAGRDAESGQTQRDLDGVTRQIWTGSIRHQGVQKTARRRFRVDWIGTPPRCSHKRG